MRWFAPPRVKPGTERASIDARVGGRYRLSFDR
ncbi:MAG: SRPBCC domain-containing protein, partial [Bradyrhizobium sp.]